MDWCNNRHGMERKNCGWGEFGGCNKANELVRSAASTTSTSKCPSGVRVMQGNNQVPIKAQQDKTTGAKPRRRRSENHSNHTNPIRHCKSSQKRAQPKLRGLTHHRNARLCIAKLPPNRILFVSRVALGRMFLAAELHDRGPSFPPLGRGFLHRQQTSDHAQMNWSHRCKDG